MKKVEDIRKKMQSIYDCCDTEKTADQLALSIPMSITTVRRYAALLTQHCVLIRQAVCINDNGRPFYFYSKGLPLTDEIYAAIRADLKQIHTEEKFIYKVPKLETKKKEKPESNINILDKEYKARELSGIYLLSSKPSNDFVKKFEAQNKQARKERKSPKAYAGTSAGMVW